MSASIIYGLTHVLDIFFNMLSLLIIVSIAISWFDADPYNQYVRIIRSLTEPIFRPFRKLTSKIPGPLDFAPMAAMFTIIFLHQTLHKFLTNLYFKLQ